jgi:hypothetical protein
MEGVRESKERRKGIQEIKQELKCRLKRFKGWKNVLFIFVTKPSISITQLNIWRSSVNSDGYIIFFLGFMLVHFGSRWMHEGSCWHHRDHLGIFLRFVGVLGDAMRSPMALSQVINI